MKLDLDPKRTSAGDTLPSIFSSGSMANAKPPHRRHADPSTNFLKPTQPPDSSNLRTHTSVAPRRRWRGRRRADRRARGRLLHHTRSASSTCRPRRRTPIDPPPPRKTETGEGRIQGDQTAGPADAAPSQTPPPAPPKPTLFTAERTDPGFPHPSAAAADGEEEGNPRRRRRNGEETAFALSVASLL
jgi:hypothetical protein